MTDRVGSLIQGMFVGAGLAVLFDPVSGRRRRARLIDRLNHWLHRGEAVAGLLGRDAWNRGRDEEDADLE